MLRAQYTYEAIGSKYYYWLLYLWIMKFSQRCFENVTLCGKQICIIIGRFWCTYVCKLTVVFCCGWNSRFKQRPWFFFIVVERVPISNQSLETQFQKLKEKKIAWSKFNRHQEKNEYKNSNEYIAYFIKKYLTDYIKDSYLCLCSRKWFFSSQ